MGTLQSCRIQEAGVQKGKRPVELQRFWPPLSVAWASRQKIAILSARRLFRLCVLHPLCAWMDDVSDLYFKQPDALAAAVS